VTSAGAGVVVGSAPVVLVAHGSRDPRAAEATRALARAVEAARPGTTVLPSWLDHTEPGPTGVLRELAAAGHPRAVLVPLLLTAAYHRKVDIPAAVAAARESGPPMDVRITEVLGPADGVVDAALLTGLRRRLAEAEPGPVDALVLAAAGTRDARARGSVGRVAAALGARLGVPCRVSYASAAAPAAGVAVAKLRAAGARRVAVAAYFLAPGLFHDAVLAAARDAGATAVAAPLTDAPDLADLVLRRVDATWSTSRAARPGQHNAPAGDPAGAFSLCGVVRRSERAAPGDRRGA
jgi:sirohydrochlorin ferrochelatase